MEGHDRLRLQQTRQLKKKTPTYIIRRENRHSRGQTKIYVDGEYNSDQDLAMWR